MISSVYRVVLMIRRSRRHTATSPENTIPMSARKGCRREVQRINEAYSVLSDEQKKAQYDNMGHETFTNASKGSYTGGGAYGGGDSPPTSRVSVISLISLAGVKGVRVRSQVPICSCASRSVLKKQYPVLTGT